MKFGFIGFGNHAQKLINIINSEYKDITFKLFNHRENYNKSLPNLENVFKLDDLFDCDAIFITSPNDTHFKYLKLLAKDYSGYIFCEKPPVTELKDLKYLENLSEETKKRIYFNFNYRFSPYIESLKNDSKKYSLGNLINASIIQGHGLALKECYAQNWRSDKKTHKTGVFETYSIHYFDMFIYLFGLPQNYTNFTSSQSPYGDSIDNSSYTCQFKNNATLNITASYTTPKINSINLVFENGIIKFEDIKYIYGPRDCFDKNGLFKDPPLITKEKINPDIHANSLKLSVKYFCDAVKNKSEFELQAFEASMNSNKMLF